MRGEGYYHNVTESGSEQRMTASGWWTKRWCRSWIDPFHLFATEKRFRNEAEKERT